MRAHGGARLRVSTNILPIHKSPSEIDPGADWHLRNWARWMRVYDVGLGFRNRTAGLESGRMSSTIEDWEIDADRQSARVADAAIGSLCRAHQKAINHAYLAARHAEQGVDFLDAVARFWELAQKRGLT